MAKFISLCDSFSIPMVFLADTPGFMVGEEAEQRGIVEAGAELMKAISRSRTAKMCVVVRKAYTAGLYAMAGPGFEPESFLASPMASISVFGRKALERFTTEQDLSLDGKRIVREMLEQSENPELLAAKNLVDRVAPWSELRESAAAFVRKNQRA
jgi:acetyl-CoA carboxylase carboxyltransferase component